jgi:hypothetical protein
VEDGGLIGSNSKPIPVIQEKVNSPLTSFLLDAKKYFSHAEIRKKKKKKRI